MYIEPPINAELFINLLFYIVTFIFSRYNAPPLPSDTILLNELFNRDKLVMYPLIFILPSLFAVYILDIYILLILILELQI